MSSVPPASSSLFRPIPNDRPWRVLLEDEFQQHQQQEEYEQPQIQSESDNDADDDDGPKSQIQVLPPSSVAASTTCSNIFSNCSITSHKLRHLSDLGTNISPNYSQHQTVPPSAFLSSRQTPPTPERSISYSRSPSYTGSYPSPSTSRSPTFTSRLPPKHSYTHHQLSTQPKNFLKKDNYNSSTTSPSSSSSTSTPYQSNVKRINFQNQSTKPLPQPSTSSSRSRSDSLQNKLITYDVPIAEIDIQPPSKSFNADDGPPSLPRYNQYHNSKFQHNDMIRIRPTTSRHHHHNSSWNDNDLSQMLHDHIDVNNHANGKKSKTNFIKRVFRRMKNGGKQKDCVLLNPKRRFPSIPQPYYQNTQNNDDFDTDDVNDTDSRFQMTIPANITKEDDDDLFSSRRDSRRDSRLDEDYWTDEIVSTGNDVLYTKPSFAKRNDTDIEIYKAKPALIRGNGRDTRARLNCSDPNWKTSMRRRSVDMNCVTSTRPIQQVDESARLLRMCKSNINVNANRQGQWDDFSKERRRGYRLKTRYNNLELDRRGMDRNEHNEMIQQTNMNAALRRNVKSFNIREREFTPTEKMFDQQRPRPISDPLNSSLNNSTRIDHSCQSYASSTALSVSSVSQVSRDST